MGTKEDKEHANGDAGADGDGEDDVEEGRTDEDGGDGFDAALFISVLEAESDEASPACRVAPLVHPDLQVDEDATEDEEEMSWDEDAEFAQGVSRISLLLFMHGSGHHSLTLIRHTGTPSYRALRRIHRSIYIRASGRYAHLRYPRDITGENGPLYDTGTVYVGSGAVRLKGVEGSRSARSRLRLSFLVPPSTLYMRTRISCPFTLH